MAVEVPRYNEPAPLAGVVQLRSAKASEPIAGEQLSGSQLLKPQQGCERQDEVLDALLQWFDREDQ